MLDCPEIGTSIIHPSFVEWAIKPMEVVKLLCCPPWSTQTRSNTLSRRAACRTENLIADQRVSALFFVCQEMTAALVLAGVSSFYF